mgnify:CR=1 FL=1
MTLLQIRNKFNLTQAIAASSVNVPLRTYIRYENDDGYGSALKRESMMNKLIDKYEITEEKGTLSTETIKKELTKIFDNDYKNQIEFCYLFGSYAKGYAKESSDIDLCVSTSLTGLEFIGLSESIRNTLHKKIDLIRFNTLKSNLELVNEIMKDGIKIYG